MDLPFIKPLDDLPDYNINPEKSLQYLENWKPENTEYLKYKEFLSGINNDLIQFKKLNPELSQLQINEIYNQYIETKKWESSLLKLTTLEIPFGKNDTLYKFKFLKSERNKLLSRRIFRPATILERVEVRTQFYTIFINCNLRFEEDEGK